MLVKIYRDLPERTACVFGFVFQQSQLGDGCARIDQRACFSSEQKSLNQRSEGEILLFVGDSFCPRNSFFYNSMIPAPHWREQNVNSHLDRDRTLRILPKSEPNQSKRNLKYLAQRIDNELRSLIITFQRSS